MATQKAFTFLLAVALLLVHYQTIRTLSMSITTNITTDKSSLLAFKSQLHLDPSHALFTNWSASAPVCDWIGVACGARHQRVAALNISRMGLTGALAPQLGNLTFLVSLDLSHNYFYGTVPREFVGLRRLTIVNLHNNTLGGQIPSWLFGSLSRLEHLDMSSNPLQGQIPQEIGALRNLKVLRLRKNELSGYVPPALYNLSKIQLLDLSRNSLEGSLPSNLCHLLPRLKELYLTENELYGQIPSNISDCSRLQNLYLSQNNFGGHIPREIGKLRMLELLYLGNNNNLIGAVPAELGNLTRLKDLRMEANRLSGPVPPQIFNISTLQVINFRLNNISGILPPDMCSHLKQLDTFNMCENQIFGTVPTRLSECSALRVFDVSVNKLHGSIPTTIQNSTLLELLALSGNELTGEIPQEIGSLNNLEELHLSVNMLNGSIPASLLNISTLRLLSLGHNQLTGNLASNLGYKLSSLQLLDFSDNLFTVESLELSFITSLTSCRDLQTLRVGGNPFNGVLTPSIGNFSTSLQSFDVHNCNLIGIIPEEISNLSSLTMLHLSGNMFADELLPKSLGNLRSLQRLLLSRTNISGPISNTICQLSHLKSLDLSGNHFSGAIPECVDNISSLSYLYLDSNKLNSNIPTSLWNLKDLIELNLSSNSLVGSLVPEMTKLKVVAQVDLSSNQLSGVVPTQIGDIQTLTDLYLRHNNLEGNIPESMGDIVNLEILDLSHNDFSGVIPSSLQKLRYLKSLDVSFNGLHGEIPRDGPFKNLTFESFVSNKGLCGDPIYHVPPCGAKPNQKLRYLLISLGILLLVVMVVLAYIGITRYRRKDKATIPGKNQLWFKGTQARFSYYKLLAATNGYNESNLLGSGGYGSVYKGTLGNGKVVAVKVFSMELAGAFKSFEVECEVLRNLRHRNLCKVIGCCSNQEFKALVLEYKPRGSLEKWLYSHNCFLDMVQRVDIMIDVACALEYLHEGCSVRVIHCDLKPSNILLDKNMSAQLCDFGVAKFLGDGESIVQTTTLPTFGYVAPEYGTGGFVSVKCDIYSYGIILMEVFTRKRPNDEMFTENLSLRSLVNDSMGNAVIDIIDPNLLGPEEDGLSQKLGVLSSILELGLNCSVECPRERMSVKDVIAKLNKIKLQLLVI